MDPHLSGCHHSVEIMFLMQHFLGCLVIPSHGEECDTQKVLSEFLPFKNYFRLGFPAMQRPFLFPLGSCFAFLQALNISLQTCSIPLLQRPYDLSRADTMRLYALNYSENWSMVSWLIAKLGSGLNCPSYQSRRLHYVLNSAECNILSMCMFNQMKEGI